MEDNQYGGRKQKNGFVKPKTIMSYTDFWIQNTYFQNFCII